VWQYIPVWTPVRFLVSLVVHACHTMTSTIRYLLIDYWNEPTIGDPRLAHYPMMSNGLVPLIGILTVYVLVVVWIGPWLMRHREPFSLRRVILLYNLINI